MCLGLFQSPQVKEETSCITQAFIPGINPTIKGKKEFLEIHGGRYQWMFGMETTESSRRLAVFSSLVPDDSEVHLPLLVD